MEYSVTTDKGKIRKTNQDSYFITTVDENSCFAVVCDGMGGSNAGDVASDIAVKTISERFVSGWRNGITVASVKNLLLTAICAANICVYDEAAANADLNGMGTTVVAAVITGDNLIIAHAGDSRAYIADTALRLVTKDHSLVQKLKDEGKLTDREAEESPYKNIITRALGVSEHIDIDFSDMKIKAGEQVLLCSDGLTNYLSEKEIFRIIKENKITAVSEMLVSAANKGGGGDNITAVVIEK